MKRHTVFRRAALALALPVALLAVTDTPFMDALLTAVLQRGNGAWLIIAAWVMLVAVECRYLATLLRLIRVRGRLDALIVLEADPVQRARRWRRSFRLVAVMLSAALAFCVVELALRIWKIEPPSRPQPIAFDAANVDNTLNALGIREAWNSLPDDDRRLRIAFLGDSIVYGHSVEPHETFCRLVASALGELSTDNSPASPLSKGGLRGVITMNLGYSATGPGDQLRKYLALREVLHPAVVVHVVYPNDLGMAMHKQLYKIYRVRNGDHVLGTGSYVLHHLENQFRYRLAWNKTIDYFRGGSSPKERAKAWTRFKADTLACKAAVEEGGAVYALVLFPWLVRLDDYLLNDVHAKMREFATELDVPYLDLLETFAGRDAITLRVSLTNEHPNAFGHAIAADRIAQFLREEVLPTLTKVRESPACSTSASESSRLSFPMDGRAPF